jgi:hypothetical protein
LANLHKFEGNLALPTSTKAMQDKDMAFRILQELCLHLVKNLSSANEGW